MKGRASAMNAGVMMPVNPKDANVLANVLLSEAEEINQRGIMIERIKRGEQPHLARFFGVIGAFEHELNDKNSKSFVYWQEGANIRNKEKNGKNSMEVNDNLKKAVETCVDFVPTPFIGADGKPLVYPVLMPQFQIALFDMLRVSDTSVGDVLRKTWKKEMKDEKEIWVEALPKEGGRRKTLQNIDWKQYHPYGDDGRAVNDNFISQIYAPLYGTINPKSVDGVVSNPMASLTSIIKAVDIGTRKYVLKSKEGIKIEKQSFEIMYASTILFQNLALGQFSVIGRGGVRRFGEMLKNVYPGGITNLYSALRNTLDILQQKTDYENYSDSFYLMLLAMSESIRPIVETSEHVAELTSDRMDSVKTTGYENLVKNNRKYFE